MPELDRGDATLYFETAGSGPALLLTHGFAATSAMFAANVDHLSERHKVITWDLRGHGRSSAPADVASYGPATLVGDMAALLDAEGAPAVVVGHSLGGYLSLAFCLAHPSRVRALVLVSTGPGYRSEKARSRWNSGMETIAERLEGLGLDALPDGPDVVPTAHRSVPGLVMAARHSLAQRDSAVLDGVPAIQLPTLIVVGGEDHRFHAGAEFLHSRIQGSTLVVIEGAGHAPNVTHRDTFDDAVCSFLDTLTDTAAVDQ